MSSNNSKIWMAAAGLVVVAAGAYGIGRVFPPQGNTSGTIAPAERCVSARWWPCAAICRTILRR